MNIEKNKIKAVIKRHVTGYFGDLLAVNIITDDILKSYPKKCFELISCNNLKEPYENDKKITRKIEIDGFSERIVIGVITKDGYIPYRKSCNKTIRDYNTVKSLNRKALIHIIKQSMVENHLPLDIITKQEMEDEIKEIKKSYVEQKMFNKVRETSFYNLLDNLGNLDDKELFAECIKTRIPSYHDIKHLNKEIDVMNEFITLMGMSKMQPDYFCLIKKIVTAKDRYYINPNDCTNELVKIVVYEVKNNSKLTNNQQIFKDLCEKSAYIDFKIVNIDGKINYENVSYEIV